jgi:hypothetical protein
VFSFLFVRAVYSSLFDRAVYTSLFDRAVYTSLSDRAVYTSLFNRAVYTSPSLSEAESKAQIYLHPSTSHKVSCTIHCLSVFPKAALKRDVLFTTEDDELLTVIKVSQIKYLMITQPTVKSP